MGEKRFVVKELNFEDTVIEDTVTKEQYNEYGVVDLLNEQCELIEELHNSDHMGWGRADYFEKELKQKKIYIKRLEYKVQKFKEMNGEQQATTKKLQEEKEYWESKAMTLLMQVRRLTSRMTDKEVEEFKKELEDD